MPTLLDELLAAHGGTARWGELQAVRARVRAGGLALASRGQARAFAECELTAATAEPWLVVDPFKGGRGMLRHDRVWLEQEGRVIRQRERPREAFRHPRRAVLWDSLDVLYFGACAFWNYLCTPFLLCQPGIALRELPAWTEGGERWRRLAVSFPPGFPTHSREQVFYVDARGYIRRHDYRAELIGRYASAAHYCDGHHDFGGIVLPTRRRVYPRLPSGRPLPFPTLIWIDLLDAEPVELSPDSD